MDFFTLRGRILKSSGRRRKRIVDRGIAQRELVEIPVIFEEAILTCIRISRLDLFADAQ